MDAWVPHVVRMGEHASGLAFRHGCSVKEIWENTKNKELSKKRANPDVLQPGDLIWLPEKPEQKGHAIAPGETVTVQMAVPKVEICINLRDREQKPVSGLKYEVIGISEKPETIRDGKISFMAPVTTKEVVIRFPENEKKLHVVVGALDPENTISGAISRLNNLEFYDYGARSDEEEKNYRAQCLEAFQTKFKIPVTRAFDETTMKKITEVGGRDVQGGGGEVTFISPPEVLETTDETDPDEKVRAYMLAAVDLLPTGRENVVDALNRIKEVVSDPEELLLLQLLAVHRYCCLGHKPGVDLEEIWSWTAEDVPVYSKRKPATTLRAEAAKAKAAFKEKNPKYELHSNVGIRSLEEQVTGWAGRRRPKTIDNAAKDLMAFVRKLLATYPVEPAEEDAKNFSKEFCKHRTPSPSKAAPGISEHGRGLATDFSVFEGDKEIAGPSTASIAETWEKGGWLEKLKEACAGTRLQGPLPVPYEPWHWSLNRSARDEE